MLFEDILQPPVLLPDLHPAVLLQFHDEHGDVIENIGMHGEFVPIHHGKHGVQMHEGAALGNVEGQHLSEGPALGKHRLRQLVDGVPLGPFRNSHRQHLG